jgi:hypothetical protein
MMIELTDLRVVRKSVIGELGQHQTVGLEVWEKRFGFFRILKVINLEGIF